MSKLFLVLILIASISFCRADELDDIYDAILIKYSKVKFYEAEFEQENYWKSIDVTQSSHGMIYFDVDNFLMKYEQPEGQILFIQNDTVTIYDAATNQAMISNNMNIELRPVNLISEYWESSDKKLNFSENDLTKITLKTEINETITLLLEDHILAELTIHDEDENFVLYKFKNAKINEQLPAGVFDVELPEDANIIDNRVNK
ncbi:MAG: outer membrane lipoprotein carrier protein LolA [Candidatus Cloacimonetes bacterium]|nr:outer membrane lipoprotein carrier protein LolA [Candidatus Cloacimonadota bacterium]MCF7813856.1 outer membrane lipoprotein carrier protein LolA [Candidatus Cloacimonadota bacterium]MCF7868294.1 outer membrane lipoprotein carrier protein LolA [Candidatus Cloacimonadota bacterium]